MDRWRPTMSRVERLGWAKITPARQTCSSAVLTVCEIVEEGDDDVG
jgi:hypothetical protein